MGIVAIVMLGIMFGVSRVCSSIEKQQKMKEERYSLEENRRCMDEMQRLAIEERKTIEAKVKLLEAKKKECHCAECLGVGLPDARHRLTD